MDLYRKNALVAGALFITATVAGIVSVPFLGFLNEPDYLIKASQNEGQLIFGALLVLVMAFADAGIPISLYPVLRRHNETLALGSVALRTIEAVVFVVAAGGQLSLLTLGREYVVAGTPDASYFQTMGTMILAVRTLWALDWLAIPYSSDRLTDSWHQVA